MSKKAEKAYTKKQFLASGKYSEGRHDLLNALLEDEKTYTPLQVHEIIEGFLKKEEK